MQCVLIVTEMALIWQGLSSVVQRISFFICKGQRALRAKNAPPPPFEIGLSFHIL